MMNEGLDPKKKVLEELMAYLDHKDGEELGAALKPKEVEVEKVEDPATMEGMDSPAAEMGEGAPQPEMSEEELAELIEALQSKIGA